MQLLLTKDACYKILVTSNISFGVLVVEDNNIIVADKDHVHEVRTHFMFGGATSSSLGLGDWSNELKTIRSKTSARIMSEIGNIQKQMSFEERQDVRCFESSSKANTDIVPQKIKNFLFRFASKYILLLIFLLSLYS